MIVEKISRSDFHATKFIVSSTFLKFLYDLIQISEGLLFHLLLVLMFRRKIFSSFRGALTHCIFVDHPIDEE